MKIADTARRVRYELSAGRQARRADEQRRYVRVYLQAFNERRLASRGRPAPRITQGPRS